MVVDELDTFDGLKKSAEVGKQQAGRYLDLEKYIEVSSLVEIRKFKFATPEESEYWGLYNKDSKLMQGHYDLDFEEYLMGKVLLVEVSHIENFAKLEKEQKGKAVFLCIDSLSVWKFFIINQQEKIAFSFTATP